MELSLIFSNSQELRKFFPQDILYIAAAGNYVELHTIYDDMVTMTIQLGEIERQIHDQLQVYGTDFIRVGRSHIINSNYISYINPKKDQLTLRDHNGVAHVVKDISPDALRKLMDYIAALPEGRTSE